MINLLASDKICREISMIVKKEDLDLDPQDEIIGSGSDILDYCVYCGTGRVQILSRKVLA